MPNERIAVEFNGPAETNFIRCRLAGFNEAGVRAEVVDPVHDEARFDTRNIHGIKADRLNSVVASGRHDSVVNLERVFALNPDFVTKITGVARARNDDIYTIKLRFYQTKVAQAVHGRVTNAFQNGA